jgi:hypothetical protein
MTRLNFLSDNTARSGELSERKTSVGGDSFLRRLILRESGDVIYASVSWVAPEEYGGGRVIDGNRGRKTQEFD